MMTRKRFGIGVLIVGVIVLLVALLLLCNTNSPWALWTLGGSILINAFGVAVLIARDPADKD